ncbi:hypothetical protein FIBSPDRAFT_831766 [Athelia psychrophila]|uniref:T6SS Phospholipase effector Tle1-like catalytic domain-containing protein n=1 Tax=Athelia psychrophila TaxID=1759441 RepID=A0A166F780_9AGAM|nr:hypothetical protein FIBSPDRAFT_831766 [Fibularhizoctonia sp. CBS 109695]
MDGSNPGYHPRASSSSETTTSQGPLTASPTASPTTAVDSIGPQPKVYFGDRPVVEPPRSRGSESRRSSGYTQTNATLPESTTATNTSSLHPRSDSTTSQTKEPSDPCQCPPVANAEPPVANAERKGRNLVICIDGTSNKFGTTNTNVVELYSQILKQESDKQLTYYDSGIGTYASPSWRSWSHFKQVVDNKIDLLIAWNLEKVIIGAYRWLSNHYREGDKIFLFGFSRGAFQVRALAGMIETVGLILPGNEAQIPFAYELYANYDADGKDKEIAPTFKKAFSRKHVRVHFVGVWDTVSSVGLMRAKKLLPRIVDCCNHVCYFRHALALDERRVKFLPEYVHEGRSHELDEPLFPGQKKCTADIKEVWFAGAHSDVYVNLLLLLASSLY